MIRLFKIYILFFIIFSLTNCGFQPIYKTTDQNLNTVNYSIKFKNEPSYEIKNKIQEIFRSSSDNFYTIALDTNQTSIPIIINTNGTVSKYRIEIMIDFEVVETENNKKVYNDVVRGFAEYLVQVSEIQTSEKRKQAIQIATQEAVQMMSAKIQSNILQSK